MEWFPNVVISDAFTVSKIVENSEASLFIWILCVDIYGLRNLNCGQLEIFIGNHFKNKPL